MNSDIRLIKRYQNRKLYDTVNSRYITLEELGRLVRDGFDVRVIDISTKQDITYFTQMQVIFEQEKKASKRLGAAYVGNTEFLSRVLRTENGTFTGLIEQLEKAESLNA